MIVKEEFLKKLKAAFDLNEYEVKIWTSLLSKGVATAGELSDISNVPRSRSYDVLESLEKKGFIIMKMGKPIKYMAIKPLEIMERLKKDLSIESEERLKGIEKVKTTETFREVELLYKQGIEHIDASDLSGAFKGRNNINSQLDSLLKKAEKSVIIMTTEKGLLRKHALLKSAIKKMKNVKIKIAAPINSKEAKKAAEELKRFADVRNINNITARFCMIDGKELVFMMMDDEKVHESYDTAVWVDSQFFSKALESLFEHAWNQGGKV